MRLAAQPAASGGDDEQGESRGICRQPQTHLLKYYSKKKEIFKKYVLLLIIKLSRHLKLSIHVLLSTSNSTHH